MNRMRLRIADSKVTRLVGAILESRRPGGGSVPSDGRSGRPRWDDFAVACQYRARRDRGTVRAMDIPTSKTQGRHQKSTEWWPRGVHALMIAQPVAVCTYLCATRMTLWFWSQVRRKMPSRKRPRWQNTCAETTGPRVVVGKDEDHVHDGRVRVPRIPLRHATGTNATAYGPRIEIPKTKTSDLRRQGQATDRSR